MATSDFDDEFTTNAFLNMEQNELNNFINERAIPVGAPTIKVNGKSFGMDGGVTTAEANNGIPQSIFSIGGQLIPPQLFAWYTGHGFIGYQACAIIAQQWLVNKACEQKGKDAVSKWFELSVNEDQDIDNDIIEFVKKRNKEMKLKQNLVSAHKFNNVFGIRHILFVMDNASDSYYEKPFNPDSIKPGTYRGMTQIDPYWIAQNLTQDGVSDPTSLQFYEPEHWVVAGKKIHRSHFVILRGAEVSDFLKPSYLYGGISLTQRIYERVYASERTANEAPQLTMTKRLVTYKLNDLKEALAKPGVLARANQMLQKFRNNYGVQYMNKDEEVNQLETSLADLDNTIMTQYQLVASIANMPATKLLGTQPKGFNATGEHEIETYHEELHNIQENELDPIVERHLDCLMRSEVTPKFGKDFELTVTWNPMAVESRKDKAEINEIKARTDQIQKDNGAIDGSEIRDRMIADEHSEYNGLEAIEEGELDLDLDDEETPTQDAMDDDGILESLAADEEVEDAEYQGKAVKLNKPFRNSGGNKKFAVYVRNNKGNVVKVQFGDPNMDIKRDDPEARKNFRARHNCSEKTDKTKAGYWSCKMWGKTPVSKLT